MLILPGDICTRFPELTAWLGNDAAAAAKVVVAIAQAAPALAARLAAGLLPGDPARLIGTNKTGDRQKALDLGAHRHLLEALRNASVRLVLSEEASEVIELDPDGICDVAIDPIDGSDSLGIGAPLGLLFSVLPTAASGFLRPGREAVAAGYLSFGHSVDMGFSLGEGVALATLDPLTRSFHVTAKGVRIPTQTCSLACNMSNERHWDKGLRRYVRDALAGVDGPRGKDFNMRWLAAAVGDLHRILNRGGAFFYPADRRAGYEMGRLRLAYEAVPIAFLIEQAGGAATNGTEPILDLVPDHIHQHTPLIFGSKEEVEIIGRYLGS